MPGCRDSYSAVRWRKEEGECDVRIRGAKERNKDVRTGGDGQSRAMEGHEQKPMLSKSGFFHCLAKTRRCHLFRSICSPQSLSSRLSAAGLKTLWKRGFRRGRLAGDDQGEGETFGGAHQHHRHGCDSSAPTDRVVTIASCSSAWAWRSPISSTGKWYDLTGGSLWGGAAVWLGGPQRTTSNPRTTPNATQLGADSVLFFRCQGGMGFGGAAGRAACGCSICLGE